MEFLLEVYNQLTSGLYMDNSDVRGSTWLELSTVVSERLASLLTELNQRREQVRPACHPASRRHPPD